MLGFMRRTYSYFSGFSPIIEDSRVLTLLCSGTEQYFDSAEDKGTKYEAGRARKDLRATPSVLESKFTGELCP